MANTPVAKAIAALVVAAWDNWDDEHFARNFDPMEHIAGLVRAYEIEMPNCLAQLSYFYLDNPLDLTLGQICELCREYIKA